MRSAIIAGTIDPPVADGASIGRVSTFLELGVRMKRTHQLTGIIEREDGGYVALCPELDIASQGDTIEEARRNLEEALELFFETAAASEIGERLHTEVYVTRLEVAVG